MAKYNPSKVYFLRRAYGSVKSAQ